MSTLEPRQVPALSWLEWLREGAAIAREGWLLYLVSLGGAAVLAEVLPSQLAETLGLMFSPAFCTWMVAISAGTDERLTWRQIPSAALPAMARALCAGVVLVVGISVATMFVTQGLGQLKESTSPPAADLPYWLSFDAFPAGSFMLVAFGFVMVLSMLLSLPLIVLCPQCQVSEALYLSLRAHDLNWVLLPMGIGLLVVVGAAALLSGAAAFLIIPPASGAAYVACRHIFFGLPPKRRVTAELARARGREELASG